MKDERIQSTVNRVAAGGYWILYILITISILYRTFVLTQHPRQFWDILVIWIIGMFFVFIGFAKKGVFDLDVKKMWLPAGISVTIVLSIAFIFIPGEKFSVANLVGFLIGFVPAYGLVIMTAHYLTRRWKRKEGIIEEEK